jgi:HK97 family phage prohead protease
MNNIELRCLAGSELRTVSDRKLVGYAAVFNSLSEPLDGFKEKIRPGAFARAISNHADVRALLNHDPSKVLGRTSAGTLELSEDRHGLRSVIYLPDTTLGRDLHESVRRGDISQMSFGFVTRQDAWSKDAQGGSIRELIDVDLMDVSAVAYPAYQATSIGTRALGWYRGTTEEVVVREPSEDDKRRLRLMVRLAQLIR